MAEFLFSSEFLQLALGLWLAVECLHDIFQNLPLVFSLLHHVGGGTINFSFVGTGSGTLAGGAFTNASFSVSIDADTTSVAIQPSLGNTLGYINLSGTIQVAGFGSASFTAPLFVFTFGNTNVGFGNFTQGNLINLSGALGGYGLVTNFGPLVGSNINLNQFQNVATSAGVLTYGSMSNVTFNSTLTGVPEPGTLFLVAIGAGVIGLRKLIG